MPRCVIEMMAIGCLFVNIMKLSSTFIVCKELPFRTYQGTTFFKDFSGLQLKEFSLSEQYAPFQISKYMLKFATIDCRQHEFVNFRLKKNNSEQNIFFPDQQENFRAVGRFSMFIIWVTVTFSRVPDDGWNEKRFFQPKRKTPYAKVPISQIMPIEMSHLENRTAHREKWDVQGYIFFLLLFWPQILDCGSG